MELRNLSSRLVGAGRGPTLCGIGLMASALVLAGCASPDSGAASSADDGTVDVLFVAGTSGPTAKIVSEVAEAMEVAMDQINADGGVNGADLKLEVLDTGGDPTRAASELQRRLSQEGAKPDLVIPGVSSVEALALAPLLTREKIVSINNAASPELNLPEQYPYHFGYTPVPADQQLGLPEAVKELGAKSVVALLGNDPYGQSISAAITPLLEDAGVELKVEEFKLDDLDLSTAYERAISSDPDLIFFEAIGDPAPRLVEAREVVGATGIPTIGGFGINSTNGGPSKWASEKANENLYTQLFASQVYVPAEEREGALAAFFEGMDAVGGVKDTVQAPFIFYDIINMYAAAANGAGSTDAEDVTAQLEGEMEMPDLTFWSEHSWSADDHFPSPTATDLTIAPQGELVDGMFRPFE